MKKRYLSIIFVLITLTSILSSCCSSGKVSSTSTFQKRKYNKGWHINTRAKASNLTSQNTGAQLSNEGQEKALSIKKDKLNDIAKITKHQPDQRKETKTISKSNIEYNNIETLSASSDKSAIYIPKKSSLLVNKTSETEINTNSIVLNKTQKKHHIANIDPNNNNNNNKSSAFATAGFILALIGVGLGWIPFLGWSICILGIVFSFIGIFRRKRRGLAIAGLIISSISLISWLALTSLAILELGEF